MMETKIHLDATDIRILELLQEDSKMANVHLAEKLKMAPSAILERVKKLEQKGVIKGYSVVVDPETLGLDLLAFIFIKSADEFGSDTTAKKFAALPQVMEVHHIAGDDCYLIKVRARNTQDLVALKRKHFSKISNILSMRTTIVMETVKESQKLVIPKL